MLFSEIYGTRLDDKLGTADRTQRFTTVKRKQYANDGQRKFNELTGCYVKRAPIALTAALQEYDIESASVLAAGDYLWPSETSASLKRVGTDTAYTEGPELPFYREESLNQLRPNWRAESAATPDCWTVRREGSALYAVLVPAPDVPAGETWTLLLPYVAVPADMTSDAHEPYGNATPRKSLRPYHDAILFYAAAECELLRKDVNKHEYWMKRFAGEVARYTGTQAPKSGQGIRLHTNYRRRTLSRPLDPTRYP